MDTINEATEESNFDEDGEGESWPDSISRDFEQARVGTWKRTRDLDFAATMREFRDLEKTFVNRAEANEAYVKHYRRCIADDLFQQAVHYKAAPFESCHSLWNEVYELGFSEIEEQCFATRSFANCCRENGQTALGLSVVEQLVEKLEVLRADPAVTKQAATYYDKEIESLRKLRTDLLAQRT